MNFQYFFIAISITLILFLIALWLNRITRIFIWNYFAGFNGILAYLLIDIIINLIDQEQIFHTSNPDAIAGLLMNNKPTIAILIYFLSFILFYKSSLFDIQINWTFKKIIWYLFLPLITVINLIFVMLIVINWPNILNYQNYTQLIQNLNLWNKTLINLFNLLPGINLILPILVLFLFLNISIKISFPTIRKKPKTENIQEENKD